MFSDATFDAICDTAQAQFGPRAVVSKRHAQGGLFRFVVRVGNATVLRGPSDTTQLLALEGLRKALERRARVMEWER